MFCSQTGFADDDAAARQAGKSLAAKLGEVLNYIDRTLYDGLILVGGDTAVEVYAQTCIPRSSCFWRRCRAELLPELLADGPLRGMPVITKSGAFGDEDTLLHTWKYIRKESE